MPFTPFHFGPGAAISLPLNRYLDIPAFLLANVAVDIEPLMVMLFRLSYPLHGYAHSFLGAALVCVISGFVLYGFRGFVIECMDRFFKKGYEATRTKLVLSSVLGGWFHVFLDSMIYHDIMPFYPIKANPFLGMVGLGSVYIICALSFIPAAVFYALILMIGRKRHGVSEESQTRPRRKRQRP